MLLDLPRVLLSRVCPTLPEQLFTLALFLVALVALSRIIRVPFLPLLGGSVASVAMVGLVWVATALCLSM